MVSPVSVPMMNPDSMCVTTKRTSFGISSPAAKHFGRQADAVPMQSIRAHMDLP